MNAPAAPLAAMSELLPGIAAAASARHDREGSFPHGSAAALRNTGLLALTVPAAVGGAAPGSASRRSRVMRLGPTLGGRGCSGTRWWRAPW
jgi:alkylation response protein AidB-like acyl-CoA dehydrogenase